jgi:hypothetical protein
VTKRRPLLPRRDPATGRFVPDVPPASLGITRQLEEGDLADLAYEGLHARPSVIPAVGLDGDPNRVELIRIRSTVQTRIASKDQNAMTTTTTDSDYVRFSNFALAAEAGDFKQLGQMTEYTLAQRMVERPAITPNDPDWLAEHGPARTALWNEATIVMENLKPRLIALAAEAHPKMATRDVFESWLSEIDASVRRITTIVALTS